MGRAVVILALILGWFVGLWAFVAVMHAKARYSDLTLFWKINLAPLAFIGLIVDWLVFNWVFGTIMFLEVPKELLLTSRVKRHYRESKGWRLRVATWWRRNLNIIDPGHIR